MPYKRIIKILGGFLFVVCLAITQVCLTSSLPRPFSYSNLFLPIIFFMIAGENYERGIWFAFGGGLLLNLFSSANFGFIAVAMLVAAVIANFLLINIFTNRSLYSLMAIGVGGNLGYFGALIALEAGFYLFGAENNLHKIFSYDFLWGALWQVGFCIILLFIFFIFTEIFGKKISVILS